MMRLLVWALLIYIGYRIIISISNSKKQTPVAGSGSARDEAAATFKDPVCGVYVSEEDAVVGKLDGNRHYFCSLDCLEKYREQLEHTPK
jgi:YHS domain-containing protein